MEEGLTWPALLSPSSMAILLRQSAMPARSPATSSPCTLHLASSHPTLSLRLAASRSIMVGQGSSPSPGVRGLLQGWEGREGAGEEAASPASSGTVWDLGQLAILGRPHLRQHLAPLLPRLEHRQVGDAQEEQHGEVEEDGVEDAGRGDGQQPQGDGGEAAGRGAREAGGGAE